MFPETFNLADYYLFDRLREGFGGKAAIVFGDRTYSYDAVAQRAAAFASLLAEADIRRGERVLLALTDLPPFAWAIFGTFARGAVVAMANPHAPPEQIAYLVEYTRATALVALPDVAARVACALRDGELPHAELRRIWVCPDVATGEDPEASAEGAFDTAMATVGAMATSAASPSNDGPPPRLHPPGEPAAERRFGATRVEDLGAALARSVLSRSVLAPRAALGHEPGAGEVPATVRTHRDEPAMWLFTSGSTGTPKANVHAHADFAFNTEVYAKRTVGYAADDVTVSVPRLFFGYATGTNLFFPFAVGGTTCLFAERPTPEVLTRVLQRHRPTVLTNVPTMIGKMLDYDDERRRRGEPPLDLSALRFSLSAGEALPETLLRRWQERFQSDVYDGIGSAEMFHIYASNRPGDVRPGSLGRAVEGYELLVLPEDAEGPGATPCKPGEIGVLWVRGPSISMGYWLDRPKSFRTFVGAYCRTGDLFRIDEEGYLYFAGRADELLKVSGQWLAPVEVEECLMSHAAVSHAAVVGFEEDGLVKPKAFVVLRAGATPSEALAVALQSHVRERLAAYKYPRIVEFVADLPRNDRGKVDRKALRAQAPRRAPGALP